MKRNVLSMICLIILCLTFSSCAEKTENTELSSKTMPDFQYMFKVDGIHTLTQKSDGGYYNLVDKNIIFTDKDTMKSTPLCDKSNCLHNGEYSDCNAKISDMYLCLDNFQIYDGKIYYMATDLSGDKDKQNNLYLKRLSLDGSKREIVFTFKNKDIVDWFLYDGYLYYQTNIKFDESLNKEYTQSGCFYKINLNSKEESKFIDFAETMGIYGGEGSLRNIYDGYMYVTLSGFNNKKVYERVVKGKEIKGSEASVRKIVRYRLSDGKADVIEPYDDYEFTGFYGNKLLGYYVDKNKKIKHVCLSDLNGKNARTVFDFKNDNKIYCDDTYFYVYNQFSVFENSQSDNQKTIAVYNRKGENISKVKVPDEIKDYIEDINFYDNYLWFQINSDNGKTSVCTADKKELLKNGRELKYEKVFVYE